MSTSPQEGDWVQVWGQVMGIDEEGIHPEDVVVEFFSHNTQWSGHIRRDRVQVPTESPSFARQCPALRAVSPQTFLRCIKHEGHPPNLHLDPDKLGFDEEEVYGYIEEKN